MTETGLRMQLAVSIFVCGIIRYLVKCSVAQVFKELTC